MSKVNAQQSNMKKHNKNDNKAKATMVLDASKL